MFHPWDRVLWEMYFKCFEKPLVTLYPQEKAQNKQKRDQLERLRKDMGPVCMQGNTLAGIFSGMKMKFTAEAL